MIIPISKFMLRFLASQGLERQETQLGLQGVPQEHVEAFNGQSTIFLEGYATCLSDMLQLLVEPLDEDDATTKTFATVMRTWLYLCSHILARRDRPNPSA